jgi:hypothetical protein
MLLTRLSALSISTLWCCDRDHPDQPEIQFDKRTFFPGRFIYEDDTGAIYAGAIDESDRVHLNPAKGRKRKARGIPNRKVIERQPLQDLLNKWLSSTHATDPLRAVRPASFILDAKGIKRLATVHLQRLKSAEDAAGALEETAEWTTQWGAAVFAIVTDYDSDLQKLEELETESAPAVRRRVKEAVGERDAENEYVPKGKRPRTIAVLTDIPLNVRRSTRLGQKKGM